MHLTCTGSEGWLHRRGGVFTGNEVVRSCGAKGQEQIRQWATQMEHKVRRRGHSKNYKWVGNLWNSVHREVSMSMLHRQARLRFQKSELEHLQFS